MSGEQHQLERNAIGLLATAALTAAYMAPALSIYTLFGPMVSQAGTAVGFVMLLGLLMTLPSAVSFGMLSREMPSAGGVYAWSSRALGPGVGVFAGIVTASYYVLTVFFPPILFGQFFNDLLQLIGVTPRTWTLLLGAAVSLVLTGSVTYRGIIVSSRLAFTMLMTELAVVVALGLTFLVLAIGGGRFSWDPVLPTTATGGWSGIFLALPMALLAMVCDAATPASEETRNARRIIPLAVVTTCLLVGIWYVIGFSAFAMAAPREQIAAPAADPNANLSVLLAHRAWGPFSVLVTLTGMTAAIGALVPCSTAASRVLFAMGREGTLPAWLGRVHGRYKAPWNAFHTVHTTTIAGILAVALVVGANRAIAWWGLIVGWYIAVVYIFANVSNIVYFARYTRDRFNVALNLLIPLIGIAAQVLVIWRVVLVEMWNEQVFGRTGQAFIAAATAATVFYAYRCRTGQLPAAGDQTLQAESDEQVLPAENYSAPSVKDSSVPPAS